MTDPAKIRLSDKQYDRLIQVIVAEKIDKAELLSLFTNPNVDWIALIENYRSENV